MARVLAASLVTIAMGEQHEKEGFPFFEQTILCTPIIFLQLFIRGHFTWRWTNYNDYELIVAVRSPAERSHLNYDYFY